MNIDNEGVKEIINNRHFAELMVLLGMASKYNFCIETDGDGAVYEDDDLYATLDVVGATLETTNEGYAILCFDSTKWKVPSEERVNRHNPDFIRETVFYFGKIEEIAKGLKS